MDLHIVGRNWLTIREAVERALNESDRPLDASELQRRITRSGWMKEISLTSTDLVVGTIRRIIVQGNAPGIVSMGETKCHRKYWLSRKGMPPDDRLAQCKKMPRDAARLIGT